MFIIEVIPLQKGIPRDTLSYFSMREIALGALVNVPLQSRTIQGIVIKNTPAKDMRASIRTGSFSLKPIDSVVQEKGFPAKIITTLQEISEQTLVPLGTVLMQLFPEPVFPFFQNWKHIPGPKPETRIIQSSTQDRFDYYKVIVRESLSKKKSIHFIASTPFEVIRLCQFFEQQHLSIPIISFHGNQKPKERDQSYEQVTDESSQVIICSTPQFFMIPRTDIGSCVIESYHSPYFVHDFTRTMDYRFIIGKLSELLGYNRYLADSVPSADFLSLIEQRKGYQEREQKKRSEPAKILIAEKEPFNHPMYESAYFSIDTLTLIKKYHDAGQPIFIYSGRKSIATVTTCRDCGYTVECPNCANIMHLIKKNPLADADRVFFCHRCETEIPPMNRCPVCEGWNLIPLGITQDALHQEIKRLFPDIPVFKSNQDVTKTDTACKKILHHWKTDRGILIGNQKIIPFLENIPMTIIASYEQCMSIPNYKTPFFTFSLFQKLLEKTDGPVIIQTKKTNEILEQFKNQDLHGFAVDDSNLRKLYHYPPYATLITITMSDISRKDHHQAKEFIKKPLLPYEHFIQSYFFEQTQKYTVEAIIHVPHAIWNNPESKERSLLIDFLGIVREYADVAIESGFPTPG